MKIKNHRKIEYWYYPLDSSTLKKDRCNDLRCKVIYEYFKKENLI